MRSLRIRNNLNGKVEQEGMKVATAVITCLTCRNSYAQFDDATPQECPFCWCKENNIDYESIFTITGAHTFSEQGCYDLLGEWPEIVE